MNDKKYQLDPVRFKEILYRMYNKYNKRLDWYLEESWWHAMKKYTFEEVKAGFFKHARQCTFLPHEKEIIDMIEENRKIKKTPKELPKWSEKLEKELNEFKKEYLTALKIYDKKAMDRISAQMNHLEKIKEESKN